MWNTSLLGQDYAPKRYEFDRHLFLVHVIHWALTVAAVPVFFFVDRERIFWGYETAAFFSFIALSFTFPARYLTNTRDTWGKSVCPELKRLSVILRIVMIPLAVLAVFGFIMLWKNGGPSIHDGVYCVWNHGFIRIGFYPKRLPVNRLLCR